MISFIRSTVFSAIIIIIFTAQIRLAVVFCICINIDSYLTTSLLINSLLIVHREKNEDPQALPQLVCSMERLTDVWHKTKKPRIKTNIHSSGQVGIALCELLIKWH